MIFIAVLAALAWACLLVCAVAEVGARWWTARERRAIEDARRCQPGCRCNGDAPLARG